MRFVQGNHSFRKNIQIDALHARRRVFLHGNKQLGYAVCILIAGTLPNAAAMMQLSLPTAVKVKSNLSHSQARDFARQRFNLAKAPVTVAAPTTPPAITANRPALKTG